MAIETVDELLNDPGDLADGFTPELEPDDDSAVVIEDGVGVATVIAGGSVGTVTEDPPTHRAVCMVDGCPSAVTYRPTIFGGGFTVIAREGVDAEASIGIGAGGRPVCPIEGHGEMTLADETIPAADAFGQVAEKLTAAVQGDLPGILPVFNYQGCYLELEAKAAEVDVLHAEYIEAKEAAADAKKAWDKAAELYTKMALEFRRRRQAKGEGSEPTTAAPSTIKCTWDQEHPDDACPLCDTSLSAIQRNAVVALLGAEIAPTHANAHADQVVTYRTKLDVAETVDALAGLLHEVHVATIAEWTPEQRAAVRAWASAVSAAPDVMSEPPFPGELGRPHIAAVVPDGEQAQRCVSCTQTIKTFDDPREAYATLALVRLDCPGEDEGHRYPDTSNRKKATRAKAEKADKPAKKSRAKKGSK